MARITDWNEQIENAKDGATAYRLANSFLLSQLKRLDEQRPEDAEAARRHIARETAKFASTLMRRTRTREGG